MAGGSWEPLHSHIHSCPFVSQSPAWGGLCKRAGPVPLAISGMLASTHPSGELIGQAGVQLRVK